MKNQLIDGIHKIEDEVELLELRGFLLNDLKFTNRIEDTVGENKHIDEMRNFFLDQLNEIDKRLKILQTVKK